MADKNFSRFLAKVLRHSNKEEDLQISPEGYVDVDKILELPESRSRTLQDVEKLVKWDKEFSKGRFSMRTYGGKRQIRATQGHSRKLENPDLSPIKNAREVRAVLHGTRSNFWSAIKQEGLSRKRRQHIHFAEGESGVQSGFPLGCDMAIEIDLEKAIRDGIQFFKSENGLILSEGNSSGLIPTSYFKKVYNLKTREDLPF